MDEKVFAEALTAVCVAMGEQLDMDRLIAALHHQQSAYAGEPREGPQVVAAILGHVGKTLIELEAVRESKTAQQH